MDYSMMVKNSKGNVELSKFAYRPEDAITDEEVARHLGSRAASMTASEIQQVKEWFQQMKIHVGDFMRERVGHEILVNAEKAELDYSTIGDIQQAWAEAEGEEALLSLAETIDGLMLNGYFASKKWTKELEEETMKKFGLEYIQNEGRLRKGCFNKQASRARADTSRRIYRLGKEKHGMIVSRRGPNRKEGDKKRRQCRVPKSDLAFQDEFLRPAEKQPDAISNNKKKRRKKKGKLVDPSKVRRQFCYNSFRERD